MQKICKNLKYAYKLFLILAYFIVSLVSLGH